MNQNYQWMCYGGPSVCGGDSNIILFLRDTLRFDFYFSYYLGQNTILFKVRDFFLIVSLMCSCARVDITMVSLEDGYLTIF